MSNNCKVIKSSKYYEINSTLRLLGLKTNMNGTKLIRKCIYYIISSDNEFYMLEDVFQKIILNYPKLNSKQIRSEIGYALNSRNERLSKKNFEKIFGYEYDSFIFTPKNFIDELINIIYNAWKYKVLQKYYYILTKNKQKLQKSSYKSM